MCANDRGDEFATCEKSHCIGRPMVGVAVSYSVSHKDLPECILPEGRDREERGRWHLCTKHLPCRKGFAYVCKDDAGNLFSTCRKSLCSARKVNRHMAGGR